MKVLVVGSGGREHAIAFAKYNAIDFTIIGMDDPLVGGIVDEFEKAGLKCFGPKKNAAILEGSKAFSKDLMKKYNIPTAAYENFTDADEALKYLETAKMPIVLKADGLALGKGVLICNTLEEAKEGVKTIMEDKKFGTAGNTMVVEEFMTGREVSVLSYVDGKTIKIMSSAQDHKRAGDGDTGLNTGGMGTIAPNPYYTPEIAKQCMKKIFLPTVNAMNAEGRTFKGCLYFGLMLTPDGPKVIEYNCRFGDPETQVVLPLLESDLFTVMRAVTNGTLKNTEVRFKNGAAACVIMASGGYPVAYKKGFEIKMDESVKGSVFVAGAEIKEGRLVTSGGRVLGVTATAPTLKEALCAAYKKAEKISFENAFYRRDIGLKALNAGKEN